MNELFILRDIMSQERIFIGSENECETLRQMIGVESVERIQL